MRTTSRTKGLRGLSLRGLALTALLLTVLGIVTLWRGPLAGLLWRVLTPVIAVRNELQAGDITRLRGELASTAALVADRNFLYQENLDLKARLGRNAARKVTLVGILMRPPGTPYDTLLIDAGAAQGITTGDLVSAGGTTLVGTVAQVYSTTARVVLFSAPGETFNALLSLPDGKVIPLTLEGQGGGSFSAKVPVGAQVSAGAEVVVPGIMAGLFATVSAVEKKEGESFETLHLHLPVSPFALRYVEVWYSKENL